HHTDPTPESTLFPYTTLFRSEMNWNGGSFVDFQRDTVLEIFLETSGGDFQLIMPSWQLQQKIISGTISCRYARKASLYLMGSDIDRKSTRLNSSHVAISYAVF